MIYYGRDWDDYLRIIKKRKLFLIVLFCFSFFLAFFYSSSQPLVYESSAIIKIEEQADVANLASGWIVDKPGYIVNTQAKIICSFSVMKDAAINLGLINEKSSLADISDAVARLKTKVQAEAIKDTNLIKISAKSSTPDEVARLVKNIVLAYIKNDLFQDEPSQETVSFIEKQITFLANQLNNAEVSLKKISSSDRNVNIDNSVAKKLTELQFQLSSLLQKYTEKHPKIIEVKDQMRFLEGKIRGASPVDLSYSRIKREIEVNKKIYIMLREKLEEAKIAQFKKGFYASIIEPPYIPKTAINQRTILGIVLVSIIGWLAGLIALFILDTIFLARINIDSLERNIGLPILGIIPTLFYDKPKGVLTSLENRFFARKITAKEKSQIYLFSHYKPSSPAAEAFRNFKTNIKFSLYRKTILVTSVSPKEGKTAILANLGIVCAQQGLKTLLVLSDLRKQDLPETLGLNKQPGIADIVRGASDINASLLNISDMMLGSLKLDDIIKQPGFERIWILPQGASCSNPASILGSKEFANLIMKVKNDFDIILFDSPPILSAADAGILAPKVDGVLLCYDYNRTSYYVLNRAKRQLEAVAKNILGIVVSYT